MKQITLTPVTTPNADDKNNTSKAEVKPIMWRGAILLRMGGLNHLDSKPLPTSSSILNCECAKKVRAITTKYVVKKLLRTFL